MAPGSRIADGNAEEGVAAVAPVSAAVGGNRGGIRRVEGDHTPLAEHLGGHRAVVVHLDRTQSVRGKSPSSYGTKLATCVVVDHDRGAPGTDDRAHFPHDDLRRLLQPYRSPQDLADGIQEIDLLVAPRQLFRHVGPPALRVEQRSHERHHA